MLKNFLIAAVSVVIALAAIEGSLRLIWPLYTVGIQDSYEYDHELGIKLRKNVHLFRLTDHLEEIRTNRFGIPDFREDYAGYPLLAFAIGDSFTQGTGLPADESYPAQLDEMVNRDSSGLFKRRIAIVNLGLGSYGGEQSFRAFGRMVKTIGKPRYCLYLGSDNDWDDDLLFKAGARHNQLVQGSPRWRGHARQLAWIGALQIVIRFKLALAERRLQRLRNESASAKTSEHSGSANQGAQTDFASTRRSAAELEWPVINRLVQSCRSFGAVTILGWIPSSGTESYNWLRDKSSRENVSFNDWYPAALSAVAAIPALPLNNPHSGGHYRGWVAADIARGFMIRMTDAARR